MTFYICPTYGVLFRFVPDDNVIEDEAELEIPDGDDSAVLTGPPAEPDDDSDEPDDEG